MHTRWSFRPTTSERSSLTQPENGLDGLPHVRVGDALLPAVGPSFEDDPRGVVVLRRLARVLAWLDDQLLEPIEVEARGCFRTVWVFQLIGYRIDGNRHLVEPMRRKGGAEFPQTYSVELLRPLSSPDWVPFILQDQGLSDFGPQRHLFRRDRAIAIEERWIATEAYKRLLCDERFRRLRKNLLPSALALNPELMRIVRACDERGQGKGVNSEDYSLIWRHERAFSTVARENARLLSLAFKAVEEGEIDASGDLVAQLYDGLRTRGVPRATWRRLAQHGASFLLPALRHFDGLLLDATAMYLRALSAAQISFPPGDAVLSLWLRNWPGRVNLPELIHEGEGRNSPVLAAFLREGQRVAGTLEAAVWVEDAPIVLEWAYTERPELDKLQRRAGWPWLMRQARAWDRRRLLLSHKGPREWPCTLPRYEADGYCSTAIGTLEALVDEGAAFHNCLGTMAGECQRGYAQFFAVRCSQTGARVAVAAVAWHSERQAWLLGNLKGPANTEVPPQVREFGKLLAAEYARRAAHLPPPASDPMAELFAQVACETQEEQYASIVPRAPAIAELSAEA